MAMRTAARMMSASGADALGWLDQCRMAARSAATTTPASTASSRAAAGSGILNIAMTSPFGHAQLEAPAASVASFLRRTYRIVPAGAESLFLDFDAELTELLSQA